MLCPLFYCHTHTALVQGLTAASAGVIADVLQHHPRLQQLVLSRNSTFGDAGLAQICAGSAAGAVGGGGPCWRNLKQLELSHCGITAQVENGG